MLTKRGLGRDFRRAAVRLCALGLLVVAASAIGALAQPCPRDRAMWIYQTPYDVVRSATEQDALFDLVGPRTITDFFLNVTFTCSPSGDTCHFEGATYRRQLRDFIRRAHGLDAPIRVHALSGNPELALEENHIRAVARAQAVLDFNSGGEPDERFDGFHLDVEPYLLPEYRDAEQQGRWDIIRGILVQYLDMNAQVAERLAGEDVSYEVDVPDFWHPRCDLDGGSCDYQEREGLLMEYGGSTDYPTMHVMNLVKAVAIMSYHPDADTIIRKTIYAMNYAALPEVGALGFVGVKTDLFTSRAQVEDVLCSIDSVFGDLASLQGYSYFKYSTYRDMPD